MRLVTPLLIVLAAATPRAAAAPPPCQEALDDPWFEHAVVLRSIDPQDTDFSDLAPLARALKGVQVLQLGEASHGDGATFMARRRLLRFLNAEADFDVLAWESGLWDVTQLERELQREGSVRNVAAERIARPWLSSELALGVFEDARRTHDGDHPWEMTGFDCQSGSLRDMNALGERLADLLDGVGAPFEPEDEERARNLSSLLMSLQMVDADGRKGLLAQAERMHAHVVEARAALAGEIGERETDLLARSLWSLGRFLALYDHIFDQGGINTVADNRIRDEAMGANLVWLARERFAGRRIATWVATFHAARALPELEPYDGMPDYTGAVTMGDVVHAELGDSAYTLAFCTYSGRVGTMSGTTDIEPAETGSIEERLHRLGHPYVFVDLRSLPADHPLREPQLGRPMGHGTLRARWPQHVDGLFFIDEMYPGYEPDGDTR